MRSSVMSAIVAGLLIGFVAVLMIMRTHAPAVVPPASAVASGKSLLPPALVVDAGTAPLPPDQARSAALFEQNRARPSDPDLASEYDDLNNAYFANILPAPRVRWESGLADLGPMIADGFTVQGLTDGRMILVNPVVEHDPDQRRRALCHEMVHMAVWMQDNGHGPVFQERLRELSLRGAFKGIVATDQEKDTALAELRRQSADIDAEERALLTDRRSLDRTSPAVVDAFNDRVRRHQAAIAGHNRLVGQYNLMVSYPDGLARERLAARADGTPNDSR
jgi:hypothetical protein